MRSISESLGLDRTHLCQLQVLLFSWSLSSFSHISASKSLNHTQQYLGIIRRFCPLSSLQGRRTRWNDFGLAFKKHTDIPLTGVCAVPFYCNAAGFKSCQRQRQNIINGAYVNFALEALRVLPPFTMFIPKCSLFHFGCEDQS